MESVPKPDTFGLPARLRVPIAARDIAAIERHVGEAEEVIRGRLRPVNAIKVRTQFIPVNPTDAPLWSEANSAAFFELLFPTYQSWVHVDFHAYRRPWTRLGMPALPLDFVLDHVANRRATRARGMVHPFIRLCPISKRTNSISGHRRGGRLRYRDRLRRSRRFN